MVLEYAVNMLVLRPYGQDRTVCAYSVENLVILMHICQHWAQEDYCGGGSSLINAITPMSFLIEPTEHLP